VEIQPDWNKACAKNTSLLIVVIARKNLMKNPGEQSSRVVKRPYNIKLIVIASVNAEYLARGPKFFTACDSNCPGVSENRVCDARYGMKGPLGGMLFNPGRRESRSKLDNLVRNVVESYPTMA
jgi:hypothetical protein